MTVYIAPTQTTFPPDAVISVVDTGTLVEKLCHVERAQNLDDLVVLFTDEEVGFISQQWKHLTFVEPPVIVMDIPEVEKGATWLLAAQLSERISYDELVDKNRKTRADVQSSIDKKNPLTEMISKLSRVSQMDDLEEKSYGDAV